jgi:L-asparaginase
MQRLASRVLTLALAGGLTAAPQIKGDLPLVWVLSTGGTIASQGETPTSLTVYKTGLLGEQLIAAVPQIQQVARIKVEQIANVSSTDITTAHWLTLANRINTILREDPAVAGVVVTHGTNTLEETAYFLNLTVRDERPVVLVGAMRPATAMSADGPLNLLNAVRTAVAPDARGKGALVVLNDEINAARDVTKTNTYRVETFRGGELGLLGYVDEDKVTFYRSTTRRHTARSEFDLSGVKELPKVDILYSYVEASTTLAQALVSNGVQGIILAGTGAGLVSTSEREAFNAIRAAPGGPRPLIVRSNRTGNGRVVARADYDAMGMVPADNLTPQKARVLLMLALTRTRDVAEIKRIFAEY